MRRTFYRVVRMRRTFDQVVRERHTFDQVARWRRTFARVARMRQTFDRDAMMRQTFDRVARMRQTFDRVARLRRPFDGVSRKRFTMAPAGHWGVEQDYRYQCTIWLRRASQWRWMSRSFAVRVLINQFCCLLAPYLLLQGTFTYLENLATKQDEVP